MDLADAHAQNPPVCHVKHHTNTWPHFAIRLQRNDSFFLVPLQNNDSESRSLGEREREAR